MPMAVRPRPIRAPAVMMAPHSARMSDSCRVSAEGELVPRPLPGPRLVVEHAPEKLHAAGADQNHPGDDDEQAAAAARRPGAVRPRGAVVAARLIPAARAQERTAATHCTP